MQTQLEPSIRIRHTLADPAALSRLLNRYRTATLEQLRAEVARLGAQVDELQAANDELHSELDAARENGGWWADLAQMERENCGDLRRQARRAGIVLNARPIGMTRDGQVGFIRSAS